MNSKSHDAPALASPPPNAPNDVDPNGVDGDGCPNGVDADVAERIGQLACESNVPIRRLERKRRALETHFARVTGADGGGPA